MNISIYTVNRTTFYCILLVPIFFAYAYLLISPYTEGDQYYYRLFYTELAETSAIDVIPLAIKKVASVEPISLYILWGGSNLGINKDIFISLLNVIMLLGLFLLCRKYDVGPIPLFLLLTNFYIIVLMTGAERLKIAYIIAIWAALSSGNKSRILFGASGLAHLQNVIMLPSLLLARYAESMRRLLKAGKFRLQFIFAIIVLIVFASVFFGIFNDAIIRKVVSNMSHEARDVGLTNLIILTVVAIFATKNRWRMFLLILPMYPAVAILGGQRVNMIAVTLAIYLLITERALNHPFVLLLLLYFSFKSIPFIQNIILYGSGFA